MRVDQVIAYINQLPDMKTRAELLIKIYETVLRGQEGYFSDFNLDSKTEHLSIAKVYDMGMDVVQYQLKYYSTVYMRVAADVVVCIDDSSSYNTILGDRSEVMGLIRTAIRKHKLEKLT